MLCCTLPLSDGRHLSTPARLSNRTRQIFLARIYGSLKLFYSYRTRSGPRIHRNLGLFSQYFKDNAREPFSNQMYIYAAGHQSLVS